MEIIHYKPTGRLSWTFKLVLGYNQFERHTELSRLCVCFPLLNPATLDLPSRCNLDNFATLAGLQCLCAESTSAVVDRLREREIEGQIISPLQRAVNDLIVVEEHGAL